MKEALKKDLMGGKVARYIQLREKQKEVKSEMEMLSAELKAYAERSVKPNEKGSYIASTGGYRIHSEKRTTTSIQEESALKLLRKKKLTDCFKEVTTYEFDERAIEQAHYEGKISKEELGAIIESDDKFYLRVEEEASE